MKIRKFPSTITSKQVKTAQMQLIIRFCHYLAAEIVDFSHSADLAESASACQLADSLKQWGDHMTRIAEGTCRTVNDCQFDALTRS
jgi:hypothetical protein